MKARELAFELGAGLVLSAVTGTAFYLALDDGISWLVASIFLCPLSAVLGIWLVNFFVLRQRGWRFLPNVLLAAVLGVLFAGGTVWILGLNLISIVLAWQTSAIVACLVWHAANH